MSTKKSSTGEASYPARFRAGIDLCLALVAADHGIDVAAACPAGS